MSEAQPPKPPPGVVMNQLIMGGWISKALGIVARLGIADLLKEGARSCDELAAATQTHSASLFRILRAMASAGIFAEVEPRRFALTPLGEVLRADVPGSMQALALLETAEWHQRSWMSLMHTVRTGEVAAKHVLGVPVFEYLQGHPEDAQVFNAAMTSLTHKTASAVVAAYDFAGVQTLVDVGGGHGIMVAAVLKAHPAMRGILFDLPSVVAGAGDHLSGEVGERCRTVGGDFFASVPGEGDAYLASLIMHDWQDADAVRILRSIRRVIPDHGRLLVIEMVIDPGNEPQAGKLLDLEVLTVFGGKERTLAEYIELFGAAGFELSRVVPTRGPHCVVEARPV